MTTEASINSDGELLDSKYNQGFLGVKQQKTLQTVSFWPTGSLGVWPEPWKAKDGVTKYRQTTYVGLYELSAEFRERYPELASHMYPLGKDSHKVRLEPEFHAPTKWTISVYAELTSTGPITTLPSYKFVKNLERDGRLHLGFVPKHDGNVAKCFWNADSLIHEGRIVLINPAHEIKSKKGTYKHSISLKVVVPYGAQSFFDGGAQRSLSIQDDEETTNEYNFSFRPIILHD